MGQVMSHVNTNLLLKAAVIDMGIQWGCCAAAIALKTEKFYDLAGSSTFLYLTWLTLSWGNRGAIKRAFPRQLVQNTCVSVWALRLGSYLVSRVMHEGEDKRFKKAKENPSTFFVYWSVQGLWVWLTLLPTMILNIKRHNKPLGMRDYIGWGFWICGFLLQAVADSQKSSFRSNPENKGKFITEGLWSYSRHPNYLGEIMMWSGLFLPASSVMTGKELLSVISPVFVMYLLTNVSGIPILERMGEKRWGHLEEYQAYKRNTARLIPFIW